MYDWDSGVYLGDIPQAVETYNVVGNSNEHGLVIGESTFGGVSILAWNQTGAVMDYGSLIYITLQRCKTAQEAIHTMVELMDTHGYASGGESFSIADRSGDVWMMEVIGRGNEASKKGAVWVAVKIPNGAVAAHANHARITTFPRDDPENCLFAPDVVDIAVQYGLYPADADPLDFSFSDTYDPLDFLGARQGEARVWSIFAQIADTTGDFARQYQPYALGEDLSHRMPLYITPAQKLSARDVMHLMTSHYEGTPMDSSVDVGAGLFASPYRPRPLVWDYKTKDGTSIKYHNERSIATAKTGWSFVAEIRPWMLPAPLAVVSWYALDDSSTAPRVPIYGSGRKIAPPYHGQGTQDGVSKFNALALTIISEISEFVADTIAFVSATPILHFDLKKAFWVQNMVSNFCYWRWSDIYPLLRAKIDSIQEEFERQIQLVDQRALDAYNELGEHEAVRYVTLFGVNAGRKLHEEWLNFYGELFVRFRDYYDFEIDDEPSCGCKAKEPGLSALMKDRIIAETGDHYRVLETREDVIQGESWKGQVHAVVQSEETDGGAPNVHAEQS